MDQRRIVSLLRPAIEKVRAERPGEYQHTYLLGVRGVLVILSFVWMFLQTFVPQTLPGANDQHTPLYQNVLRWTLSVPFWNANLIYSCFIFLSARSIAVPFLQSPSRSGLASTVWRRTLTLLIPVAVSLAIVKGAFSAMGLEYIYEFKQRTGNDRMNVPYMIPGAFAWVNSVFKVFWTTHDWPIQAANTAFPTQTLWVISAIYQQSYTVYMTMVIIPYTRSAWRVKGGLLMVITAWWVQSWAWYTISGLLLADMVINMEYKRHAQAGVPIPKTSRRIHTWVPCAVLAIAGFFMQYVWTAWRPSLSNEEYMAHTDVYGEAGLNVNDLGLEPQPRDDIYLIVLAFFLFLDSSDALQRILDTGFLKYLGRRSLSYFLIQGTILYTLGVELFSRIHFEREASSSAATFAVLVTSIAVVVPLAEVFYRVIELPSSVFTSKFYDWVVT